MIILGIDPGSLRSGYGVVRVAGSVREVVEYGVLDVGSMPDHANRLKSIYDVVAALVRRCGPDACAVEMPVYGQNPQSMLKLGRAQAAAMLAAINGGVPVSQYTPKTVKKSVTGNGNASKEQVRFMVKSLLVFPDPESVLRHDASDALAIALCHSHRKSAPRYADWGAFLAAHPGRL